MSSSAYASTWLCLRGPLSDIQPLSYSLAPLHSAQTDTEAFDEGFDRHIWSLADQSLRWDLQIGRERRTKPEELERQMRELLASQGELDAEEAAALEEVADEGLDAPPKEDRTCISLRPAPWRND